MLRKEKLQRFQMHGEKINFKTLLVQWCASTQSLMLGNPKDLYTLKRNWKRYTEKLWKQKKGISMRTRLNPLFFFNGCLAGKVLSNKNYMENPQRLSFGEGVKPQAYGGRKMLLLYSITRWTRSLSYMETYRGLSVRKRLAWFCESCWTIGIYF